MSAQPQLPGIVASVLARADVREASYLHGRATMLAQVWRDAFDLYDAQDLCAGARWAAGLLARAEARGVDSARELAELRVLVREVARRVAALREVLGG